MKAKLSTQICYMAGMYSKAAKNEKNFVSINTTIDELSQHFVEFAVKDLEIAPNKILFGRVSKNNVGFYHSRIAKQLIDIANRETYIFKTQNELSCSYIAGIFDASGHFGVHGFEIRHITPKDAMMLENLGIHSKGDAILNISKFLGLIKNYSILAKQIKLQTY